MKAILLAAGLGTRLRPITDTIPKCLVLINGRPLLDIWLENLTKAGVGPFLINTFYLADKVEAYIKTSKYKDYVTLVRESELLGTAGTLRANYKFLDDEDGMLIHADNYCLTDFNIFLKLHAQRPPQCVMSMMSFYTDTPESCGIIEVDNNNIVTGFYEKMVNPPGNLANGAVYILSKEFIQLVVKAKYNDFSTQVIPNFIGRIFNYENKGVHIDIGNPIAYKRAQNIS